MPRTVAVNPAGTRVYVANVQDGTVSVIDTATNAVVATVALNVPPSSLAVDASGKRVYAGSSDGWIDVVDATTNALAGIAEIWASISALAVDDRTGLVYAALVYANSVSVVAGTAEIASIPTGGWPWALAVDPVRPRLYVSCSGSSTLHVIDTRTHATVGTVDLGGLPAGVAVDPAGTRVYVADERGTVVVVDAGTLAVVDRVRVGRSALAVAVTPDGARVLVTDPIAAEVVVLDAVQGVVLTSVQVGGAPMTRGGFVGPDLASTRAVEYRHIVTGDWFTTANPAEIDALDDGAIGGWSRTGTSFLVRAAGSPRAADVCRYWSGATYAPHSAHFLSPLASECAAVATSSAWRSEGTAFAILASAANGGCAPGTAPLHRLYNGGTGGFPAHRYTNDAGVRDAMLVQGWVAEGAGGVIGCVPLR
jgi:YVTN family beta-propeller protein